MKSTEYGNWRFQFFLTRDHANTLDIRYTVATKKHVTKPSCWIFFLNGRTEWIEKYLYVPEDLDLPDDCGFVTMDHRGQGASGGLKSHVDSYLSFAKDAAKVAALTMEDAPFLLMSHSMGGLIGLTTVLQGLIKPRGAVFCSPLLGLPEYPVPSVLAEPLSKQFCRLQLGFLSTGSGRFTKAPFAINLLTHSHERFKYIQETPYPCGSPTFSWVNATFEATNGAFDPEKLKNYQIPTLLLAGTGELVVNPSAFQRWVQSASEAGNSAVEFHWISGAKHELLAESEKYYRPSLNYIKSWMKQHFFSALPKNNAVKDTLNSSSF